MRKYIFVLIVFSLVLFCHSQEKNSITTGNLKGKVKTLKETIYEIDKNQNKTLFITEEERPYKVFFDERGNVVENEQYDSEGKVFLKYINIYTYHNNIIKSKESYCRGYLCMNEGKIITKYNNKGLVIEITIYDDKGEVISTEKFQYDEKDKLIKETLKGFYYSEGGDFEIEKHPIDRVRTYNYKYENGNLIEETCSDGEIKRYDTKGRIVEERRLDYTDCFYNYDEHNNNLVEEIKSYGSKIFYRYDNRNNIIEKISTDGDKTTYKYDEKGNWIEKHQNNFLTERIIEYY